MAGLETGKLDKRIRIEAPDMIDNDRGGRKPNPATGGWKEVKTVWGEILALRGDEATRNSIERSVQLWKVTVRMRRDVTTSCRLVWLAMDIHMDIKSAAPNVDGDGLVMTCESGARA
jgi:head-tail adaptor